MPDAPAGYSGTPLAKKLGIATGSTVAVLGAPDGFGAVLDQTLPDDVSLRTRASGTPDVVVSFHTRRRHLERRVDALLRILDVDGGLWIAWPKRTSGVPTDMTEDVVRDVFLPLGLVDNKVCAIDATWSGLRVVWRKERRPAAARRRHDGPSMIGCYPGSFNPPTVAHLAVAESAVDQGGLDRLDLVVSRVALGKEDLSVPTVADRIGVLDDVASTRPWLGVALTDAQLLVDVAAGYDVLVLGADKWAQVLDPDWYGSVAARDDALARLHRVLVAPRADVEPTGVEVLRVADHLAYVSATAARAGAGELMLPEATAFDARTGAWSDPSRYRAERG